MPSNYNRCQFYQEEQEMGELDTASVILRSLKSAKKSTKRSPKSQSKSAKPLSLSPGWVNASSLPGMYMYRYECVCVCARFSLSLYIHRYICAQSYVYGNHLPYIYMKHECSKIVNNTLAEASCDLRFYSRHSTQTQVVGRPKR